MVRIISEKVDNFIRFLENNYPSNHVVYIHILEDCDSVGTADSGEAFGAFDTETNNIFVAADRKSLSEYNIFTTLAHEYKHFLQKYDNGVYDEDEAEIFAESVYREFIDMYINSEVE